MCMKVCHWQRGVSDYGSDFAGGQRRRVNNRVLSLLLLLLSLLLPGAGVVAPWLFSAVLFIFTLCKDAWITWVHIKAALFRT